MSNSIINIRFGCYHFVILRDYPFVSISYNKYQANARISNPNWKWFEVMELNF